MNKAWVPALGLSAAGFIVYVLRALVVELEWKHAHPGGMGLLEDYVSASLGMWTGVCVWFLVIAGLASLIPVRAPVTRLERLLWGFVLVSLFQACVLPRAGNFAANGGADDALVLGSMVMLAIASTWGFTAAFKRASAFEAGAALALVGGLAIYQLSRLGGQEVERVSASALVALELGLALTVVSFVGRRVLPTLSRGDS